MRLPGFVGGGRRATLRTTLLLMALMIVSSAAAVMVGSVSVAMAWRDAVEKDTEAFLAEQRIADQILALTYEQQLAAYRFLQSPNTLHLTEFRSRGDSVYRAIRGYLFYDLSMDARLQVENIKETHQQFEVAAERGFDLVRRGRWDAARLRVGGLDERATELQGAVSRFLQARTRQRAEFQKKYEVMSQRLRLALLLLAAIALVAVGYFVAGLLRRRVLQPLNDLAGAARRLGEGDAGARVPRQPYVEFDVVASGFNQMADRVQASRESAIEQNRELQQALDYLHLTQEELVQHEKLSAMGQMLAGLAHELNNPLGGILGMAECLRQELSESPDAGARGMGRDLAAPLEREALRANALVRSLLTFARKPGGTLESVGLAAAVSTAVGLRAHAFAQAGKTLHVDVSPSHHVIADAQKLQHAVVNVVNNALDAIVAGGGEGLVIRAHPDGDAYLRLEFDDDGTGIENIDAAFTPFYTTKKTGEGTGLGLVLVQRFMGEFGGTVTAANRAGGGTRITLRLRRGEAPPADHPARIDDTAAVPPMQRVAPAHDQSGQPASSRVSDTTPEAGRRPRVLVVDDEPSIREIQRRLLTRAGLDVLVAAGGSEARDIMLRESVDLVVSDLRMPGEMDGYALLEWMEQERPELAETALLATGDVSGTASVALPVPADRILNKPFAGTEFVERVMAALRVGPSTAAK